MHCSPVRVFGAPWTRTAWTNKVEFFPRFVGGNGQPHRVYNGALISSYLLPLSRHRKRQPTRRHFCLPSLSVHPGPTPKTTVTKTLSYSSHRIFIKPDDHLVEGPDCLSSSSSRFTFCPVIILEIQRQVSPVTCHSWRYVTHCSIWNPAKTTY